MLELKSLITLSIFLFSYPPSFASPEPAANPDPQWWGGGNRNGNNQQQGQLAGGWGQAQQQQQGPQWGVPNQNPRQGANPPYQPLNPRPGYNPAYPKQTAEPAGNPAWPQPPPRPANNPNQNAQNAPNWSPPQVAPPSKPTPTRDPEDDEPSGPKWTPPPNWGPRTTPFGPPKPPTLPQPQITQPALAPAPPLPPKPKPTTRPDYCTNTDLICTTTIDEPKEPVPYAVTCGKSRFNEYDVTNALNTGCYWYKKNAKISNTEFPKVFDNSKGRFDFGTIKGPFMEFPLIDSAGYVSGPPGPHRVIFSTPDCFLAGELTTEGSRGGVYTECTEEF